MQHAGCTARGRHPGDLQAGPGRPVDEGELLLLQEDQLYARGINLHILTGICAGLHRPDGTAIAGKMLFMVAAMAAEMEGDLIRERTLAGLRAAHAEGRRGGRPAAINDDLLTSPAPAASGASR